MAKKWSDMLKIGKTAVHKGKNKGKNDVFIPGTGPKRELTPEQKKKQAVSRKQITEAGKKHHDRLKKEGKISKGKGLKAPKPGSKVGPAYPGRSKTSKTTKQQEEWRKRTRRSR